MVEATLIISLILYTGETHNPSSVFSTLASLFLVSPFMALSHFLLLSPAWPFSSFMSMGELDFRRLRIIFSLSVSSCAFCSGFICGKHEMTDGYVAICDGDGLGLEEILGQTWDMANGIYLRVSEIQSFAFVYYCFQVFDSLVY